MANRFLDQGNYLAYGLAAVAAWVTGIPHGLAVMHGKTRRGGLVFDIADLIKDALVMPQAFIAAMEGEDNQQFRQRCINAFQQADALDVMITTLQETPRRRKPMILLDNILRYCLDDIFKGFFDYDALNAYSMKMTRDAEYDLVHEMEASLMELMSSSLKQRLTAEPVRFVYQRDMPDAMVEMLRDKLTISRYDSIIPGGRYHNFKDFIGFPNVGKANLVNKPLPRLRHI